MVCTYIYTMYMACTYIESGTALSSSELLIMLSISEAPRTLSASSPCYVNICTYHICTWCKYMYIPYVCTCIRYVNIFTPCIWHGHISIRQRLRYRIVIFGVVEHALDLSSVQDSVALLPLFCGSVLRGLLSFLGFAF